MPSGALEIEREASLVAVQVLEVGAMAAAGVVLLGHRHLDLDDIGAPVGELPHADRPAAHPREVEHLEARQR